MTTLIVTLALLNVGLALARASGRHGRVPATIDLALHDASARYHVPYGQMVAVARCETGGFVSFRNARSGASGLFQFLPSTWAHTPYRRFNVMDHLANAMAAAWLYVHDGRSWREWSCQP